MLGWSIPYSSFEKTATPGGTYSPGWVSFSLKGVEKGGGGGGGSKEVRMGGKGDGGLPTRDSSPMTS